MKAFGKKHNIGSPIEAIEIERSTPGNNELLIKMGAIGVGIHDEYFHRPDVDYPYVIGIEGAGVVEEVGQDVKSYSVGDKVAFTSMMQSKGGTWAEYAVIADDSLILPIPEGMTMEQAAAIPVPTNTSFKAMFGAGVESGDTLFIAGGAGAIGSLLIQIAKAKGVTVIASASERNHQYMKDLGADYAVDYHDQNWQEQVKNIVSSGVDAAIGIHPGTPAEAQAVVKDGGVLVAVSGDQLVTERGIELKGVFNNIDVKTPVLEFMDDVVAGKMKLTVDKVYPFDDALAALDQVKTRHTRGKIVLSLE